MAAIGHRSRECFPSQPASSDRRRGSGQLALQHLILVDHQNPDVKTLPIIKAYRCEPCHVVDERVDTWYVEVVSVGLPSRYALQCMYVHSLLHHQHSSMASTSKCKLWDPIAFFILRTSGLIDCCTHRSGVGAVSWGSGHWKEMGT